MNDRIVEKICTGILGEYKALEGSMQRIIALLEMLADGYQDEEFKRRAHQNISVLKNIHDRISGALVDFERPKEEYFN